MQISSGTGETVLLTLSLDIQEGSRHRGAYAGASVTEQQTAVSKEVLRSKNSIPKMLLTKNPAPPHSTNTEAIAAGLEFLMSRRQDGKWRDFSPTTGESDVWVTAYVLARLGEFPRAYISHAMQQQITESLEWLKEVRNPAGGWGYRAHGKDSADATAWAIIALRRHGQVAPRPAFDLVRRCQRPDGGFAAYPATDSADAVRETSAPDITAVAVKALETVDPSCQQFLASHLRTDIPGTMCRLASRFVVSSTILDWDTITAPWPLLNQVCQFTAHHDEESVFEQALLLRCLLRLRIQKAWSVAASLRLLQQGDGSWPGSALLPPLLGVATVKSQLRFDDQRVFTTATAVSALVMGESQPGLYFGSDVPFRRLDAS